MITVTWGVLMSGQDVTIIAESETPVGKTGSNYREPIRPSGRSGHRGLVGPEVQE